MPAVACFSVYFAPSLEAGGVRQTDLCHILYILLIKSQRLHKGLYSLPLPRGLYSLPCELSQVIAEQWESLAPHC